MVTPFLPLPAPDLPIANRANGFAWSPDERFLAVATNTGLPALSIYRVDGSQLTRVAGITNSTGNYSIKWSSDGRTIFAVSQNANSRMAVYRFDGNSLTLLAASTASQTPGELIDVDILEANGITFIAAANPSYGLGTSTLSVFKWDGSTLTLLPRPSIPYTGGRSVSFTPDGKFLAQCYDGSSPLRIFERQGEVFTALPNIAGLGSSARYARFHPSFPYLYLWVAGTIRVINYLTNSLVSSFPTGFTNAIYSFEVIGAQGSIIVAGHSVSGAQAWKAKADGTIESLGGIVTLESGEQVYPAGISGSGMMLALGMYAEPRLKTFVAKDATASRAFFPTFSASAELDYIADDIDASSDIAFPSLSAHAEAALSEREINPSLPFVIYPAAVQFDTNPTDYRYDLIENDVEAVPPYTLETVFIDVEAFLDETATREPSNPYAYGNSKFPAFGSRSSADFGYSLQADARFPGFSTDGTFRFPIKLESASAFPSLATDFNLAITLIGGESKVAFPGFKAEGEIAVPTAINGDLSFSGFIAQATATSPHAAEGQFGFKPFSVTGMIRFPIEVSGENIFATFSAMGESEILIPDHYEVDLRASYPSFRSSVDLDLPLWSAPSLRFPSFGAHAEVKLPLVATGNSGFPKLNATGRLGATTKIDANTRFPAFRVEAGGGYPIDGEGSASFGAFRSDGFLRIFYSLRGEPRLPSFGASATAKYDYRARSETSFPPFSAQAEIKLSFSTSAQFSFPRFESSVLLNPNYELFADASFPGFTAKGAIRKETNAGSGIGFGGNEGTFAIDSNIYFRRSGSFKIG